MINLDRGFLLYARVIYNGVETSIYRNGGLQIQDEKRRENSNEFTHVLLKMCCTL